MAKILIVEDNEMNRDMLSRRLIRRGYEIVMAVDGDRIMLDAPRPLKAMWVTGATDAHIRHRYGR